MVTAADGAPEFYQTMNNEARSEDIDIAIALDRRLQKAWSMHPNSYIVDNSFGEFDKKVQQAQNFILKMLGMPVSTEFHKKYSVRNPLVFR